MGYGGKVKEQKRARELRAQSWTLMDIAKELGDWMSDVVEMREASQRAREDAD